MFTTRTDELVYKLGDQDQCADSIDYILACPRLHLVCFASNVVHLATQLGLLCLSLLCNIEKQESSAFSAS